jgi:hypothetical protein
VSDDRSRLLRRLCAGIGDLPHALIGGQALLVHGLARQTDDIDVLVADRSVLDAARWPPGDPPVVVRRATEPGDPLDGLIVLAPATDDDGAPLPGSPTAAEAVVLDRIWAREMLTRARSTASLGGVSLPVVDLPDLAILKAYAGGPVDRADVAAMSERPDWPEVRRAAEQRLATGPATGRRTWERWMRLLDPGDGP